MNKSLKIGVFFGSRSPEHEISIITGQLILSGLRGLGYEAVPVYISKAGEWLLGEDLAKLKTFTDPRGGLDADKFGRYVLDLKQSVGRMVFRKKSGIGKTVEIELAFPAFHGSHGEDGTFQGVFEIFGLPYVGCDVTSSALAMDKILTKQLFAAQGIPTRKFLFFSKAQFAADRPSVLREIETGLQWPVFVKPARLGSSIGVAKVRSAKELEQAIEVALHYDERFLAEESVENLMDVTCSVLGDERLTSSFLQESVFSDELFSYDDKYLRGGGAQLGKAEKNLVIPARLDARTTQEIRELAQKIFRAFGCAGIARVDFLYDKGTAQYYANEINTLPGTLYHHLWAKSGVALPDLLQRLMDLALARHEAKQKLSLTFESDLLRFAGGAKTQIKKPESDV